MSARQRLSLRVALQQVACAEALLQLAGAEALSLADAGNDPVIEPAPNETPLWPLVAITALFSAAPNLEPLRRTLASFAAPGTTIDVAPLAAAQWREAGRGIIAPQPIGRRLWLGPPDAAAPDGRAVVRLRMGLAFGTGAHPTTALCLEWLEDQIRGGERVVDYGCGSGVLGLAALMLGADRACAIDNDPQALAATADNSALNGLQARISIGPPDSMPAEPVDLIVANIVADPLVELAPLFADRLLPGTTLVLSGVLAHQLKTVHAAYEPYFDAFETVERDGWCRLVAHRAMRSSAGRR